MENLEKSAKKPTLCLNMIVKNESNIITRLLKSVLPIIDCYCICDTGSTDNTVKVITDFFYEHNIPGSIVHQPFINFAFNRNYALNACQGKSDFVLLLDADMVLKITNFDKSILNKYDSFHILQGNEDFYYHNCRIVRNNGLYKYIGVTHEYIDSPANNKNLNLNKNQLFITDLGDGGSKTDKFERDIRLLTKGIIEEPHNAIRYHFYLANSYHDCGEYEKAIEYYKKKIDLGGWNQEIWYSYYRIGICYKKLNRNSESICSFLEAYNYLPERLESLYEIIHYYRNTNKNKLCFDFYHIALDILNKQKNIDDYLFVHKDIYSYKLHYEYSIIAFYNGITTINDIIVKILNASTNSTINNNLLTNMKFYKHILTPIRRIDFTDHTKKINLNDIEYNMYSSSSCLIPDPNSSGYLMNVRYVNYFINSNGNYLNCDKNIITTNEYVKLDNNFNVAERKLFDVLNTSNYYVGIEDVRIFNDKYSNQLFLLVLVHLVKKLGLLMENITFNLTF